MDRRQFLRLASCGVVAIPLGCETSPTDGGRGPSRGRLNARWREPSEPLAGGEHPLGLSGGRDGFIRLPAGYQPDTPVPLALLLHGAGGNDRAWDGGFPLFDELGLAVLSVASRASSWEVVYGGFGPDTAFIDAALDHTFERVNVDPARIAISGFSDGASYALSLGLTNGDVFRRVVAFSPGFLHTEERHGKPPVFLSHGTSDQILPVTLSRALEEALRAEGHAVHYEEFDGGHEIPRDIGALGFTWFVDLE